MEQTNATFRFILAGVFALAVIIGTAYLQIMLGFSTYIALVICLIAACIFAWIVS
jgi:hypothetical protein